MLQQNSGKPADVTTGLKAAVEYMFGNQKPCTLPRMVWVY